MWYILIIYFVGIFFWNIYAKEYDDENKVEKIKDIFFPILGVIVSVILSLIF